MQPRAEHSGADIAAPTTDEVLVGAERSSEACCVSRRGFLAGAAATAAVVVAGGVIANAEPAAAAGTWVTICKLSALKVGVIKIYDPNSTSIKGLDRPVALVRHAHNTVSALDARCTHQGCTVGVTGGKSFVCPCHYSKFSGTGHRLSGPAPKNLVVLKARVLSGTKVQVFINPASF